MIQKDYMHIKSICGCVSYNMLVTPYPYTHPIRPDNVGMMEVSKHESDCDIAKSIRQDILLAHQSLDSVSDASTPNS